MEDNTDLESILETIKESGAWECRVAYKWANGNTIDVHAIFGQKPSEQEKQENQKAYLS